MLTKPEVISRLKDFVQENFAYMRPDLEVSEDASLIATGVIDSMGVMEVVEFISEEFGVVVADRDITEENIGTLNAIADYVLARQPAGQARQSA